MLFKKITITILIILIFLAAGLYFFNRFQKQVKIELNELAMEKPELVQYIDRIKKSSEELKQDPENLTNYLKLGLSWKSLADQTRDLDHYYKALKVYETAVDLTQRKNILPMINAGNMAIYLKDYQLAKQYYEEALTVSPGDFEVYQRLIDLHLYQLKSPKDEIVAIFDRGINKMVNPTSLIQWKESYLKSQ